jgi:transcription initiation factor TFIIH subunit 3
LIEISLLVVFLDANPFIWKEGSEGSILKRLEFSEVISSLLVFLQAYLLLHTRNMLGVFIGTPSGTKLVFSHRGDDTKFPNPGNVFAQLKEDLLREIDGAFVMADSSYLPASTVSRHGSQLAAGLSQSLCFHKKMKILSSQDAHSVRSRLLVINVSEDVASQYIPMMNVIFCAQRDYVPIDVLQLCTHKSSFLQQAAELSNGVYLELPKAGQLLPEMMLHLLPDERLRPVFRQTSGHMVDYRASCFCHRQRVDIGFVCSVCLSIFCQANSPICAACGSRFPKGAPPRSVSSKKQKKSEQNSALAAH